MADKKAPNTKFQHSLKPEDQAVLQAIMGRMVELKKVIKPVIEKIKAEEAERTKLGKILRDMLLRYEDIPQAFEIGGVGISYTQGEEYIDEQALLMEGVSKQVVEKCKRRRSGFFVVDRQGRKGKGEE